MKEKTIKNFKKELREVLEKYNATIEFACGQGSDTHGLYSEEMLVCFNKKDYSLSKGWVIYAEDLK
jgi:hypothetical protein